MRRCARFDICHAHAFLCFRFQYMLFYWCCADSPVMVQFMGEVVSAAGRRARLAGSIGPARGKSTLATAPGASGCRMAARPQKTIASQTAGMSGGQTSGGRAGSGWGPQHFDKILSPFASRLGRPPRLPGRGAASRQGEGGSAFWRQGLTF